MYHRRSSIAHSQEPPCSSAHGQVPPCSMLAQAVQAIGYRLAKTYVKKNVPGVKPDLDELKLEELLHLVVAHHAEKGGDDVCGGVAQVTQVLHDAVGPVQLCREAVGDEVAHQNGVRLVAHLEHIVLVDQGEAAVGCLPAKNKFFKPAPPKACFKCGVSRVLNRFEQVRMSCLPTIHGPLHVGMVRSWQCSGQADSSSV